YFKYETGDYIIRSSLLAAHVNILYQYWYIKNLLAFNARAGMGISSLLGYTFEFHTGKLSTPENFAFFSWGAGLSAQLVVFRLLYLEAGVDYYHIYDSKMPMGFLRFAVSTGWRF
ncbi:MAG: hypothetical protein FWH38_08650, partial [Treponema sp.]|nr:hypothetical protein [Treponema sp.]